MTDRLLTVMEVAEMLRIGRTLAYQLVRDGVIASVDVGETGKRVKQSALDDYIDGGGCA